MAGDLVDRFRLLVAACCDQNLSPAARAVLAQILDHYNSRTGQCTPSLDRLARTSGVSRRSAIRGVNELCEAGWIERDRSVREGGRSFLSNSFRPTFDRGLATADLVTRMSPPSDSPDTTLDVGGGDTADTRGSDRADTDLVTGLSPKPSKRTKEGGTKSESIDAAAFDRFWAAFPRKVGKGAVRPVFQRIVSKGQATADELTAGAERYAAATAGKDPEYIAHPKSWLNAERWADEPVRPRALDNGSTAQPHHSDIKPNSATAYLMDRRARRMGHG
jgi:Helix-turn-helix domain